MDNAILENDDNDGEFLWLVSLSDLMILLFVFFVVLFSFYYKKAQTTDISDLSATLSGNKETKLETAESQLLEWAKKNNLLSELALDRRDDSVVLRIKEKLLFESGSSAIKNEGLEMVSLIGEVLSMLPPQLRIGIEGHTDSSFMRQKGSQLDGNWRLSTLRALNVLENMNLAPEQLKRVVVLGYGPNLPLEKKSETETSSNRRVSIRIY